MILSVLTRSPATRKLRPIIDGWRVRLPANSRRVPILYWSRYCRRFDARRCRRRRGSSAESRTRTDRSSSVASGKDQELLDRAQALLQEIEVARACRDETVETIHLRQRARRLHVGDLQIVADVRVRVLVVVAVRQIAELPAEALAAGVFLARRAVAVASPVAKRFGDRSSAPDW